ncbi:hypothetical protein, partial [Neorhizobium galegae]|uniref:hypothetical protein n=1 Tax=Neorhizobium galegae TaxID=399 RepID=UPI00155E508B
DEGEFKRFLGATRTEAMKAYPRIDAEFDRLVVEAARLAVKPPKPDGPLEIHRAAQRLAEQRGKHPVFVGGREVAEDHPDAATFFVNITSPAFRRS